MEAAFAREEMQPNKENVPLRIITVFFRVSTKFARIISLRSPIRFQLFVKGTILEGVVFQFLE
ncbi:MAG: hypothetical protein KA146_02025 [Leptospiraceae bacterium]|nr:hypothetical protein [Leptospiraceae bacterium]